MLAKQFVPTNKDEYPIFKEYFIAHFMKDKKLQVFVSSTYIDLKEERQAAVEAILQAGHIPAGMELFTAGDESQMTVIKRWIDESDVYLLILGERYGSLDKQANKSYTQLEYEYAVQQKKPLFALVKNEKALKKRLPIQAVLPLTEAIKFDDFRNQVLEKVVKKFNNKHEIKVEIANKLSELEKLNELVGWIRPGKLIAIKSFKESGKFPTNAKFGRAKNLNGTWTGIVQQTLNENVVWNFHTEIRLNSKGFDVFGTGSGHEVSQSHLSFQLDFNGYFRNDRFLKLDYCNTENNTLHFGTFILELKGENNRLEGRFTGYGSTNEIFVWGAVNLEKND